MKKIILFSILAGSLLIACNKETFHNQGKRQSVGFQISGINNLTSQTRGGEEFRMDENLFVNITVEDNTNSVSSSTTKGIPVESEEEFFDNIDLFKVWCWNNTAAVFTNPMVVRKNVDVYMPYSNGNFLEKTFNGITWTTPKFYALAPSEPAGVTATASDSKLDLAYVTPASTGNRKDAENMQDWLVGAFSGSAGTDLAKNLVPLTFEHPLARLDFKVGYVGESITVDSIKLNNIISKGTYTCTYSSGSYTYAWSSVDKNIRKSFVQEFGSQVTTSTEGNSIVDPVSKSFFVIPYSYTADDIDTASMIKVYYTSPSFGQRVATLPLRLRSWEAGKTYTYTFHIFNGPWVDYDNIIKLGGKSFTKIASVLNDSVSFIFPQSGGSWEKCCIPIHKLLPDTWYELDFYEAYTKDNQYDWNMVGSYTCGVLAAKPTSTSDNTTQITYYNSENGNPERYFWSRNELKRTQAYCPPCYPSRNKLLFKATATDMYWVFELSKCIDSGNPNFSLKHYAVTPVTKPSETAIDFVESTFYNFKTTFSGDDGHSTFKSYAKYGTKDEDGKLEFHANDDKDYKKLNIPLINLVPGTKYMISFDFQRETQAAEPTAASGYGYYISETKDSDNVSSKSKPGYVDLSGNITLGTTYSTFTLFTATQQTMYLVIDLSALEGARNIVNFTKARIYSGNEAESQVSADKLEHKVW